MDEVTKGEIPLNSYTLIHDNLSKTDRKLLLQWAVLARLKYKNVLNISFK
ncbi:MAG: hypothetical protein IIB06_09585 [Bacteroidetes bacterium]|nr:hypothetical protein [Bacteroidota bacterium]